MAVERRPDYLKRQLIEKLRSAEYKNEEDINLDEVKLLSNGKRDLYKNISPTFLNAAILLAHRDVKEQNQGIKKKLFEEKEEISESEEEESSDDDLYEEYDENNLKAQNNENMGTKILLKKETKAPPKMKSSDLKPEKKMMNDEEVELMIDYQLSILLNNAKKVEMLGLASPSSYVYSDESPRMKERRKKGIEGRSQAIKVTLFDLERTFNILIQSDPQNPKRKLLPLFKNLNRLLLLIINQMSTLDLPITFTHTHIFNSVILFIRKLLLYSKNLGFHITEEAADLMENISENVPVIKKNVNIEKEQEKLLEQLVLLHKQQEKHRQQHRLQLQQQQKINLLNKKQKVINKQKQFLEEQQIPSSYFYKEYQQQQQKQKFSPQQQQSPQQKKQKKQIRYDENNNIILEQNNKKVKDNYIKKKILRNNLEYLVEKENNFIFPSETPTLPYQDPPFHKPSYHPLPPPLPHSIISKNIKRNKTFDKPTFSAMQKVKFKHRLFGGPSPHSLHHHLTRSKVNRSLSHSSLVSGKNLYKNKSYNNMNKSKHNSKKCKVNNFNYFNRSTSQPPLTHYQDSFPFSPVPSPPSPPSPPPSPAPSPPPSPPSTPSFSFPCKKNKHVVFDPQDIYIDEIKIKKNKNKKNNNNYNFDNNYNYNNEILKKFKNKLKKKQIKINKKNKEDEEEEEEEEMGSDVNNDNNDNSFNFLEKRLYDFQNERKKIKKKWMEKKKEKNK